MYSKSEEVITVFTEHTLRMRLPVQYIPLSHVHKHQLSKYSTNAIVDYRCRDRKEKLAKLVPLDRS